MIQKGNPKTIRDIPPRTSEPTYCSECEGTGYGLCANCGDGHAECACDDSEETECSTCEGTGIIAAEEE